MTKASRLSLRFAARFCAAILGAGMLSTACAPSAVAPGRVVGEVEGRGANKTQWWDALPRPEWRAYQRVLPATDWFEIYRVLPDVYAIYEPGQFEEVISFLVVGGDRALLFDTGLGVGRIRHVVEQLTDKEVIVVNSHAHYDHIGGNHEFSSIAGVNVVYARDRTSGMPAEDVAQYLRGEWVWRPLPDGFDREKYRIRPYNISATVADGDVIELGNRSLEVLLTPGHSPDSLCLLDRENRLLLTGDTFYLAPLYAHLEGSDVAQYRATAKRLAELQPGLDYLLTAHNVPLVGSDYLGRMRDAFDAIENGTVTFVETDGAHEYGFENFSVIVPAD